MSLVSLSGPSRLDSAWVRSQFPAFGVPDLQRQAFFENAGGSYTCSQVIGRLMRFYTERKMQPYAPAAAARAGGAEMDEARVRLAAMLGIGTEELSFGPSTSANTYVLSQAVRRWLKPGQAIIVTDQDHEANSGCWRRLAEDGVEIREWRVDRGTGLLDPEDLRGLLADGRVALLTFPHCSNVIGAINDVAMICALAREAGARTVVDGVSYAPHGLPDVDALGADVYLFSAYKVYGPHQGIMAIREDFGCELPNQGHWFNGGSLYKRFTPAGPDHAQVAACAGIADYIEALAARHGAPMRGREAAGLAHDLMRAHEVDLSRVLLEYLATRNSLKLLGPDRAEDRAPTFALAVPGDPEETAQRLAARGIMCWAGDFYARRPLEALGLDPARGVLRLSFTHYTTREEISTLIAALDRVV